MLNITAPALPLPINMPETSAFQPVDPRALKIPLPQYALPQPQGNLGSSPSTLVEAGLVTSTPIMLSYFNPFNTAPVGSPLAFTSRMSTGIDFGTMYMRAMAAPFPSSNEQFVHSPYFYSIQSPSNTQRGYYNAK